MNQVIRQFKLYPFKKEWLPLIILTALSLLLWFAGPSIAIADSTPLQQPEKRFYLISLLFLAWFLKTYYFQTKKITPKLPPYHPDLEKKIQTLSDKFQGFVSFLNKTLITREGADVSLSKLPWFLLIGTTGSGKTTLLANANVNYVLAKKFKPENIRAMAASNHCDWWVMRDAVLVDIPGKYIQAKPEAGQVAQGMVLWDTFLQLIKRARGGNRALQGIVVALSLPELLQQKQTALAEVKERIGELRAQFGNHLPFHILLTKCDVLPGFTEFFSDSGTEELSQAWGITLPEVKETHQLADIFSQRFNTLIKRLNKQLISRLHQERNPHTRPQIKDFPLHIERLKESLCDFLKSLAQTEKHFHLQGVYLTSAIQQHEEPLVHLYSASSTTKNTLPVLHNIALPGRPYFIRQFLMQGLTSHLAAPARAAWKYQHRPAVYTLFATITLVASLIMANDFRQSLKLTEAVSHGLAQYQAAVKSSDADITKALPLLNALEARTKAFKHAWLFHTAKTRRNATMAYREALQSIIFASIKNNFESYLQTANFENPEQAYLVLKAYLELGDKERFKPETMFSVLKSVTFPLFAAMDNDNVMHHINAAFALPFKPVQLNQDIITEARKHLANAAPVDLSYIILKNSDNNAELVNLAFPELMKSADSHLQVPRMYTGERFTTIYGSQIETAALEVVQGNWILGNNVVQQTFAPLVEQLRTLYLTTYVKTWEALTARIQTPAVSSLDEVDAQVVALTNPVSPLLQSLNIIKQNTNFAPVMSVSTKLAAIDALPARNFLSINSVLKQLHTDIQKIQSAHNPENAALQAAADRMQDTRNQSADPITQLHVLARSNPEPVKHTLDALATTTWHVILQQAGHYAEDHWQTDVMTSYHANFENRYPLWADAKEEIPLTQFEKFMNPSGTLINYFKNYLVPFVEVKMQRPQWKKMDNEQLPFTDDALSQIVQALQLQPILFPDDSSQVSLRFTLQPHGLSKNAQSISLKVNGQGMQYDRSENPVPQSFNWSNDKNVAATTISFLSRDNQRVNNSFTGDWGWFRLVNQSIGRVIKPNELMLNFTLNGYEANYFLFTHGTSNPFLILQQVRLPLQLSNQTITSL